MPAIFAGRSSNDERSDAVPASLDAVQIRHYQSGMIGFQIVQNIEWGRRLRGLFDPGPGFAARACQWSHAVSLVASTAGTLRSPTDREHHA